MTAANEDFYPLTPMQQGMLFHALSEPHSGVDIEQLVIGMPGIVEVEKLRAAWERVVARHAILRTAFRWDGAEPMQVVAGKVTLPFDVVELPPMAESDRTARIAAFLHEDRARGFAMDAAPLLRLTLFTPSIQSIESIPSSLVWTFHHALLDGRSFPLILDEVFAFYENPTLAEPPPRPFREFVEWQRTRDIAASENFWRQHLAGFTAPTPLVVDHIAPPAASVALPPTAMNVDRGASPQSRQADAETNLSIETTATLRTFAESIGVTLNTLVQAAWAILLSRYSREEDVCFGATRACRAATVEDAEKIAGIFINTVPVRVRAPDNAPLVPWLRELRKFWVDVRPHEHTPLARVQSWSDIPAGRQLFQTLVVFENYDLTTHFRARGGAWANRTLRLHEQTNFPICLAAYAGQNLRLVAEYAAAAFDAATIARMLAHIRTLLENLPLHRDSALAALPMLTDDERAALIAQATPRAAERVALPPSAVIMSAGASPAEPRSGEAPEHTHAGEGARATTAAAHDWCERTLHEIFSAEAARTPDATALVQGDTRITYAQLDAHSDAIAAHLIANGARRESIVGLCMERTPALVAALIGILKAGAAYLPIDLAYPPERLAFMLEDARAPLLLTQRSLAGRIPQNTARVIFIEDVARESPRGSNTPPREDSRATQLCYILYTSGSTGQPKGCCITHRNVVRLFTATEPWFRFDARDVWTLFHSTAFDFSVWEIWGALLYGGTLVVVPFEISRSPEQFHKLLIRERVTVLNQTPSAFRQLIAADLAAEKSGPLALRTVIFGGEALEMQSLKPWFDRHGDARPQLVNMYGITETTVHVTYRPLRATDTTRGSVIGFPIPDLRLHILDPRGEPAPIGVPGELHVGGPGLARGYHERPELTAQRFIADPFSPGEKLYRTGDLARRLPDGDIEYLGRIDQQVKIRGFRIELGEIESRLLTHPAVRECCILARDDGHGGKKLIAWFVAQPSIPSIEYTDFRAHLARTLPDYMLPAAFVRVEKMPLTTNGKLDTRALPAPSHVSPLTSHVSPTTLAERALAEIWQRILKIPCVGIHDNFFELGGDSILSILVVSQARKASITITPKQIFDTPTIAALAAVVGKSPIARLAERPAEGEVPLTPIQRWFFAHDFADAHHWDQRFAFELTRDISPEDIAAAFEQVVAAHPVFRLQFTREESGWTQEFARSAPRRGVFPSALNPEGVPKTVERTHSEPSTSGVPSGHRALGKTPLLAPPLLRYTLEGRTLIIAIHHLIVDGVSWRILLEDLDAALRHAPLAAPTTSFHTWAHALSNARPPADELAHWKSLPNPKPFPRDFADGENTESSARTQIVSLDATETNALLRELRPQEALLTALAHALADITCTSDHVIEIEGHGREESVLSQLASLPAEPDLSRSMGWFTTIFPIHLHTAATPARTYAGTRASIAAIPRHGFGWMLAQNVQRPTSNVQHPMNAASVERPIERSPFAVGRWTFSDILFNYLGHFDQTTAGLEFFRLAGFDTVGWRSPAARRTHVLEINCLVLHGRLEVRITFSTALHRPETIARLAGKFADTLRTLIAPPFDAALAANFPGAESAFPLSPMQRLFLALEAARPGSGNDQWHSKLTGGSAASDSLPARLQTAWAQLAQRHATLRTAYIADSVDPQQIVLHDAPPEWHIADLRALAPTNCEAQIRAHLTEAARPFDLTRAPLTRLALFRIAHDEHIFAWTHHHLEIDGWSWPLVFRELHALLAGESETGIPSVSAPLESTYRDYITWLSRQPSAESFWREHLRGFQSPTPLPLVHESHSAEKEITATLTRDATTALNQLARELRTTVNTLVQAAWAILLAHHSRTDDVVFGAAFSGRPAELPGVESIIGHFVNNLPVRATVTPGDTLASLVARLHSQLARLADYQHTPLEEIAACSELPWSARLFSTLLVFQNYLGTDARLGDFRITELHAPVRTNYPLTLVAKPGEQLALTLIAQRSIAAPDTLDALVQQLATLLSSFAPGATLAGLTAKLPQPIARTHSIKTAPATTASPSTPSIESNIAEIWREALTREVAVTDNFFDVGGHSLLMLRVHARLSKKLGREIPVVKLFQHPTIRSLAQFLAGTAPASKVVAAAKDRAARARAAMGRTR